MVVHLGHLKSNDIFLWECSDNKDNNDQRNHDNARSYNNKNNDNGDNDDDKIHSSTKKMDTILLKKYNNKYMK